MALSDLSGSIKTKAIDAGQNFLTGQITTVFAASGMEVAGSSIYNLADDIQMKLSSKVEEAQKGAMQIVSSAGAGLGSAFGTVVGVGDSVASTLTTVSDMAQEMVSDMATQTVNKITKATNEIVNGASTYFTERISYYSKAMLQEEMNNITAKYLSNSDEKQNEEVTKKKDTWMKKATQKVGSMVNDAKSKVNESISYMNEAVGQLQQMEIEGPQWISTKLSNVRDSVNSTVDGFINDKVAVIKNNRNAELDKIASTVAKHTVKPTIDAANKKLDKLWNDTNQSKAKVQQKAKTLIQKAKFKLAGLTGVSPL